MFAYPAMKRLSTLLLLTIVFFSPLLSQIDWAYIPFRSGDKWGFVDAENNLQTPVQYDAVGPVDRPITWVRKGDRYGYVNLEYGVLLTKTKFKKLSPERRERIEKRFNERLPGGSRPVGGCKGPTQQIIYFEVFREGDRYGFLLPRADSGKLPPDLDYVSAAHLPQQILPNQNRYVAPALRYDTLIETGSGSAIVALDGRWGMIDRYANEILPLRYDRLEIDNRYGANSGRIKIREARRWGFVNEKGEMIIPPQYASVAFFRHGLAKVTLINGQTGYIDAAGTEFFE